MNKGELIVAEARRWIGVRWRHQGRSRAGVDCIGLCLCALEAGAGATFDAPATYARRPSGRLLQAALAAALDPVQSGSGQAGDIALFSEAGQRVHVGILASKEGVQTVIHAHARRRAVVEEPLDVFGSAARIYRMKESN